MNNRLLILGIAVLLLAVGLSGCNEKVVVSIEDVNKHPSNYLNQTITVRGNNYLNTWITDENGNLLVFSCTDTSKLIYNEEYYWTGKLIVEYNSPKLVVLEVKGTSGDAVTHKFKEKIYTFRELIDTEYGWYDDGFYVTYNDTTSSTVNATLFVYYYYNSSNLQYTEITALNSYNFTFSTVEGCNLKLAYKFDLIATLDHETYGGTYRLEY